MEVLAVDPDGTSSRVSIETSLYALTPAGRETPGRINASSVASSSIAAPATFLDHRVSVADKYYLLGVELVSRSAGLAPAWYGARVYRRGAAAPAEIAPGGSLRIAFGAERDQRDAAGRVWHVGNRFLAPGHPPVARSYHPGTVDVAQLTDPVIPNGVLETAHWCGCDMHYQFAVLNARYRVVLYFSENCVECVGPPWGGTSNNSAHREFSVEVESQALAKFDIADAAWPPLGDGRGRTFTATQIAFDDVLVSDGVLDLRLLDLGPLNPPENPSINGISIEWIGP
jgi:hypothetical protein